MTVADRSIVISFRTAFSDFASPETMGACFDKNAYGFYEKLGMHKPNDVVALNKVEWTDFTVEHGGV